MTHEMNNVDFCRHCGAARVDLAEYPDLICHPTLEGARFAKEREKAMRALVESVLRRMAECP